MLSQEDILQHWSLFGDQHCRLHELETRTAECICSTGWTVWIDRIGCRDITNRVVADCVNNVVEEIAPFWTN